MPSVPMDSRTLLPTVSTIGLPIGEPEGEHARFAENSSMR